MAARTLTLLGLVALSSCSGDDQMMMVDPPDDGLLDPAPPAGGQQLTTDEYVVPPGEEKYFCYTFRSPSEAKAITRVMPIQGDVVHHVALFKTMTPEPDGFSECPVIIKLNWEPIWAGGAGDAALDMPEGVGFVIQPDTQYLVQYHLQNVGSEPVTERSAINLTYVDAASVTKAGLFALGTFSLTIPSGASEHELSIPCQADRTMNVFAVFPHMHKLGLRIGFETGTDEGAAQQVYMKDPWAFGEQPMDPLELTIQSGDFMRSTCWWNNDTGMDVTFGESSDNEMCFFVVFYYPFTGLAGCVM
jgi:hypothetical protein